MNNYQCSIVLSVMVCYNSTVLKFHVSNREISQKYLSLELSTHSYPETQSLECSIGFSTIQNQWYLNLLN